MNTLAMFAEAKKRKLAPIELVAHTAWALVAQSGRPPMTVGEVCKHVALTSGIKPSTYQVRTLLEAWTVSDTAFRQVMRVTPVAPVIGYTGGENAVLMLAAFVHVFIGNKDLYEAIHTAVTPVRQAAIDVSNSIYNYNQDIDAVAVEIAPHA